MGTVKYSQIKTSDGVIEFDFNDNNKKVFEIDVDNYEYLRVYNATSWFRLYINHSNDYIIIKHSQYEDGQGCGIRDLVLEDFQINHIKLEIAPEFWQIHFDKGQVEFYMCK
ncbi:hypothetical protein Ccar_16140 [Clostridium carboxidivorans P7]|uniref:Uncharacterized protein n=1 Tax=Clostridium carboxidivorans P7 TaxID=536227 RepID=C6Q153_9CLOT|nr:hypothetical protein [Clostridium carboxidivorans]AKN32309.1 hypothetical protein Ccar_16140 [Clostridium carboxidivorans P7]EET84789.1 conserved hypothetical protein [Clostridium carboxidivorans P7]